MEASCFFTSTKPFNNISPRSLFPSKKRLSQISCCNDGGEAAIGSSSDWRTVRARLVAGEQASILSAPPAPFFSPDRWAHPIHEPEKGCLLIATEKLDGVHIFERTVILLLSTGPLGSIGLILNRPSLMSIKETRSTDLDVDGTFSGRPLFFGGPLEEGLFLMGPRGGEGEDDKVGKSGVFEEVMKGLYYGSKESVGCAAEMVKRDVVGVGEFRFFDGHCGWEKGQLREEIWAGLWKMVACSPSVIGLAAARGGGLYEDISGLAGVKKVR